MEFNPPAGFKPAGGLSKDFPQIVARLGNQAFIKEIR